MEEKKSRCGLEAVVTVDERGQIVLPRQVRKKTGIKAGDKLALITCEEEDRICCLILKKVDEMRDSLNEMLSPITEALASK